MLCFAGFLTNFYFHFQSIKFNKNKYNSEKVSAEYDDQIEQTRKKELMKKQSIDKDESESIDHKFKEKCKQVAENTFEKYENVIDDFE